MTWNDIKEKMILILQSANVRSRDLIELANQADELLCTENQITQECLEFYLYILSTPSVFEKRGVYSFIDGFRYMRAIEKLSPLQKNILVATIEKNHHLYVEPNFRASIDTFVKDLV